MASRKSPYSSARYKTVKKNIEDVMSRKTSSNSNNQSISSKIGNYETRLSSIGIDTEEAKDTRNPVEKFFNVKEDQNFLFDIFEVLGRPQQALFGGIESVQQGGSFLEGAAENWKGEDTTNFGDILKNAGVSDKGIIYNPITKDDASLADILGLAGDIFADPIDIGLIASVPLTGGATAPLAGAKIAGNVIDVAKVTDKVVDAAKIAKASNIASDVAKTRLAIKPFAKDSKSLLELAVGAGAKAVKGTAGVADNLITKALTKADDINLQKLVNAGEDVSKFVGKADAYKGIKKAFSRTADYSSSIPDNLYSTITRSDNALDAANAFGKKTYNDITKSLKQVSKETGLSEEYLNNAIKTLRDASYKPSQTASEFLVDAVRKGENTFKGSEKEVKAIKQALEDFKAKGFTDPITNRNHKITDNILNIEVGKDGKSLTIRTSGKNASKNLNSIIGNKDLMKQLDDIKIKKSALEDVKSASKEVRNEVLHDILDAKNIYRNNESFRNLYKQADDAYEDYISAISNATDGKVDLSNMYNTGYTRTASTDEGGKALNLLKEENVNYNQKISNTMSSGAKTIGNKETFSEKTFSPFAKVADEQYSESIKAAKDVRLKRIEKLKENLYDNKVSKVKGALKSKNEEITALSKQYAKNKAIVVNKSKNAKEMKKMLDAKVDSLSDIIDEKVLKKAKTLNNDDTVISLVKKTDTYNSKVSKFESLKNQLNNTELTQAQARTLGAKLEKAYKSMKNAKADVVIQTEKVINSIDEKFVKEAKNIANTITKDLTKNLKRQATKGASITKLNKTSEAMRQGFDATLNSLKKEQSKYALELKSLLAKSPDAISKENKLILDEIGNLEKELQILDNADVQEVFTGNFLTGFGDFVDVTSTQAKSINTYNEVLLHSGMKNEKVMKFVGKGETVTAGDLVGMKKLDVKDIGKMDAYLEQMKNFLPKDSKLIKEHRNLTKNSKAIYMDEGLYDLIHLGDMSETKLKPLMDMLNNYNNFFKKYSTLTPGFHVRNISGNATNMVLSGVPINKIPGLYAKADKLAKPKYIMDLYEKSAKGTLNAAESADFKIVKKFIEGGFAGTGKEVRDLGEIFAKATTNNESKNIAKKALDKVFELNVKGNEFVDSRNRMALLLYADSNPKYIKKLGAKDAIDATKKVLFDPKNLSPFEQKYMKKIIPFYTFTKQNLIFQANNILRNTSKYNRLVKTFNETYDAVGEENYRQYQKENFEIPLFMGDEGLTTIKANLPVSDLGEYLENPLQRLVSSTSPLIKTPFELTSGVDTFTGQDISDRSGLETLSRSLGLTNVYNATGNIADLISGETEITPATVAPSIFRYSDAEKIANQREYEELIQYQQIVKDLKNQGIDVPTISELRNSTNATLKAVKKRRNEIQKRRS